MIDYALGHVIDPIGNMNFGPELEPSPYPSKNKTNKQTNKQTKKNAAGFWR